MKIIDIKSKSKTYKITDNTNFNINLIKLKKLYNKVKKEYKIKKNNVKYLNIFIQIIILKYLDFL